MRRITSRKICIERRPFACGAFVAMFLCNAWGCSEHDSRSNRSASDAAQAATPPTETNTIESPPTPFPAQPVQPSQGVRVPVEERSTPQGFVSETGTAALTGPKLSPETVPLAPMGVKEDPSESVLDGVQDPNRVVDQEADSVRKGKRDVGPISEEFGGGFDSAEDLARAILTGVGGNDPKALHALRVSNREFARIFWPEFPQSRPANNVTADDAWFFHDASCHDGVSEIISEFGGRAFELIRLQCKKGRLDYSNFDLYDGIVIEAVDSHGERVFIPWATTFAERNGKWKVFLYNE